MRFVHWLLCILAWTVVGYHHSTSLALRNWDNQPIAEEYNISISDRASSIPPCISDSSELAYVHGTLSSVETFIVCANNIPDPAMLPTYYNGSYHGITVVNSAITMNNSVIEDWDTGKTILQFSLRLYWKDDRFSMPTFWENMHSNTRYYGIDLTDLLLTDDQSTVDIWLPLLHFPDTSEITIHPESLQFNASNIFVLSCTYNISLTQPAFDLMFYPYGRQTIVMRFAIINFNIDFVRIGFADSGVFLLNPNLDTSNAPYNSLSRWMIEKVKYDTMVMNEYEYCVIMFQGQRRGIFVHLILSIILLHCIMIIFTCLSDLLIIESRNKISI